MVREFTADLDLDIELEETLTSFIRDQYVADDGEPVDFGLYTIEVRRWGKRNHWWSYKPRPGSGPAR
jgi:hypothetical protein